MINFSALIKNCRVRALGWVSAVGKKLGWVCFLAEGVLSYEFRAF